MFNKKWKMIAAFAASFSLVLSAGGASVMASSTESNKTAAESTLDIAGAADEQAGASQSDGGSLLDLAESMEGQEAQEEEQDGLLALIDGAEEAPAAQAEPAPAEPAPSENAPTAEEAPEEAPAIEAPTAEAAPEAQAEPAPEAGEIPLTDVPGEAAPLDEGAVLQTPQDEADGEAEADTEADTQAETEAAAEEAVVNYDKLAPTGSVTDGVTTLDVTGIVENVMPSIVSVTATSVQKVRSYFSAEPYEIEGMGAGSGIIISQNDTELLIATNYHITNGSKDLTVCFSADAENEDDLIVPAVLKGETNRDVDLAVLAVKLSDIKPEVYSQLKIATLGSSDTLKVGQAAIVIGNALGYGQAVSTGIISALDRPVETETGSYREFMTDASVNLGCSGGAILNTKGEVVGIVNAKDTADYAEGMGYGIPIDSAIPILQEMINRETRETVENHGYLGITVVPVSEEASSMYDMPQGAYVYEVTEGSAADQAGIEKGNIITAFDGIPVGSSDDLVNRIGYYEVGETVKVKLEVPDGGGYTAKEVEVTLQAGAQSTQDGKEEENKDEEQAAPQEENDPLSTPEDGNNNGEPEYYEPYGNDYGFYYGQGEDGRGYEDPFSWFFGNNERGSDDGWGPFYFGN